MNRLNAAKEKLLRISSPSSFGDSPLKTTATSTSFKMCRGIFSGLPNAIIRTLDPHMLANSSARSILVQIVHMTTALGIVYTTRDTAGNGNASGLIPRPKPRPFAERLATGASRAERCSTWLTAHDAAWTLSR